MATTKVKITPYIPTDLWDDVRRLDPNGGHNHSTLTEEAFRSHVRFLEEQADPMAVMASRMRQAPSPDFAKEHAAAFARAVDTAITVPAEHLEFGYRMGLELAATLSFREIGNVLRYREPDLALSAEFKHWARVQPETDPTFPAEVLGWRGYEKLVELLAPHPATRLGMNEDFSEFYCEVPAEMLVGLTRGLLDVGLEIRRRLSLSLPIRPDDEEA